MDKEKRNNKKMNIIPSFNDATQADQAIYQLAAYDVSNGMIVVPKSIDQAMLYQIGIAKKFNYFKRLIQKGEVSFKELQNMVVTKNGPYINETKTMSISETIDQITSEFKPSKQIEKLEKDESDSSLVNVTIEKLLRDILADQGISDQNIKTITISPVNDEINSSIEFIPDYKEMGEKINKGKTSSKKPKKIRKPPKRT